MKWLIWMHFMWQSILLLSSRLHWWHYRVMDHKIIFILLTDWCMLCSKFQQTTINYGTTSIFNYVINIGFQCINAKSMSIHWKSKFLLRLFSHLKKSNLKKIQVVFYIWIRENRLEWNQISNVYGNWSGPEKNWK